MPPDPTVQLEWVSLPDGATADGCSGRPGLGYSWHCTVDCTCNPAIDITTQTSRSPGAPSQCRGRAPVSLPVCRGSDRPPDRGPAQRAKSQVCRIGDGARRKKNVVTAWSNDAVVPAATLWQRRFEAARLAATSELRSRNLAVCAEWWLAGAATPPPPTDGPRRRRGPRSVLQG